MISAFGVVHDGEISKRKVDPERGGKSFGSPAATAAVVGGGAALLLSRGRANRLGEGIAARMHSRAAWSAGRAAKMPAGRLKNIRSKYAGKLDTVALKGPSRNEDVREWAARGMVGGAAGGVAGGAVYTRRKLTPKTTKGQQ